jgi:2-dehydro-3-deoxygalactonokinase
LKAEELQWAKPDCIGPTYLISGLATENEMMRGEETEIIGLMAQPNLAALGDNCLMILPGTHSKHVRIKNHSIFDWRTFMTGELFEVLGKHSLLRASVALEATRGAFSESERASFQAGVLWGQERGLAGGLFRVRTRAVLERRPLAENTWFFSGLLIGAELAEIGQSPNRPPVILAAAGHLAELYAAALEAAIGKKWLQLPAEQLDAATISAHSVFLQNKLKTFR